MPALSHRVVTGDEGPVLVKRASGAEAAARLTGEATVLRTLAHPGTVRVLAHRTGPERAELHLAWVGPHSLATVTGLPVAAAGSLVAQVAGIVADLHRAGVVHGRLTADHVLLGVDGRAVLTGFASAAAATPEGRVGDVAALGALLASLVAPHDGGPVIPEHRRTRGDGGMRAVLLTLSDRAQSDDPPTAAELAESIQSVLGPDARQPVIRFPAWRGDLITGSGRKGLVGVALAACVAATVAAAAWIAPSGADPEATVPTTSAVPTTSTTTTSTTTTPPTTTTTAACPPVEGTAADVDGDGCVEMVTVAGERVTVEGTTWTAGRAGDLAVVGDWDCDGRATIASLRVGTGEVFVFDRWERALTVDAVTQVDGATAVRAVARDGCATLVVDRAEGEPVEVAA